MRINYLLEYGGPDVDWSDNKEPDYAALYPIPASQRVQSSCYISTPTARPAKRPRHEEQTAAVSDVKQDPESAEDEAADEEEEEEIDDDDGFWLSPRMACRLCFAGSLYVDSWCRESPEMTAGDMPPVVQPYAKDARWMEAYSQAAMRLVRRLEKGVELRPNCTAEEFALHQIIGLAKDCWEDGIDEAVADVLEALPRSTRDEDFFYVSDAAFQDHDVLELYDRPELIHPSPLVDWMNLANLHPQDWFKPFQPQLTSNHA